MKGIEMLCVSQVSTAICEEGGSSSAVDLGGRAIDRHNPIIFDKRRSSAPIINPKPCHQVSQNNKPKKKGSSNSNSNNKSTEEKRKSEARVVKSGSLISSSIVARAIKKSESADLVTPAVSSRYLLGEASFVDGDSVSAVPNKKTHLLPNDSSSSAISNQVVVLRVSLHCKGCEGKVRKHLSRMQGVRSFNIDFAAKKVTVVGDVSPVSVLASISKVKNAQILTNNP